MRSVRLPLTWTGPGLLGLREVVSKWDRTPYVADCAEPGVGVDCVRFVCSVLGEVLGRQFDMRTLPQDTALHRPDLARAAMRQIMQNLRPFSTVGRHVQGGDVLVVGAVAGGPGHAMIVGWEPSTIWHATYPKVQKTGFTLSSDMKLFKVYRHGHRD